MPLDPDRLKALLDSASQLPDPTERLAFLDRECGEDRELRLRLEELLKASDDPASTAEAGATDLEADSSPTVSHAGGSTPVDTWATVTPDRPETAPGEVVGLLIAGRYKIVREIGEGGMGSVYLADQLQPVRRQVAVKLIKAGMDSRTVLARFDSERQALALMDHPHIAKVLDAGTTDRGGPFFVMELVKGVPLTQYCDQNRLPLNDRLALFGQICSAVQHAHQKGIIHRDLKPGNILVETHDGKPVPKVIDFGLAKAVGGVQLTENALESAFGSVAGTPLYMAPEQARFDAVDVDTRADIYALGVILYELLTGSTPITRESLRRSAFDEMMRVIREVEPPTPSSRIGSSESLPSLAALRQVEPSRLGRFVRGELDWIVMKALAKERHRRYDTPLALSHDIERFLNHEPVSAGPPSSWYRMRKFVRRHRLQVSAAAMVLLALVAGIVGTTLGLIEATKQRTIADNRLIEVTKQRKIADDRLVEARTRLKQRDNSNAALLAIFADLNPNDARQKDRPLAAILGERLDAAAKRIEGDAVDDPVNVARMQRSLGITQVGLGHYEEGIRLLTKARDAFRVHLGDDHDDTIDSLGNLAITLSLNGKMATAVPMMEEVLRIRKAKPGQDDQMLLQVQANLAGAYVVQGKFERAIPLYEETIPLLTIVKGRDDPSTMAAMNTLGLAYEQAGKYDLAAPLLEEALELKKKHLGDDNPSTLTTMNNLAICLERLGKLERSRPLFEKTYELTRAKLGEDHPDTLNSMSNLAASYMASGQYAKAVELQERTVALLKKKLGDDHPQTLVAIATLGRCYRFAGKLDLAAKAHEESLPKMIEILGDDHIETIYNGNNLANVYLEQGDPARALPLYEEAVRRAEAKFGPDHAQVLGMKATLARCLQAMGQLDRAIKILEGVVATATAKVGPDHPITLTHTANLAAAYQAAGKRDEALALYEKTFNRSKATLGTGHPQTLQVMSNLAATEKAAGKLDQAAARFRELAELWKAREGDEGKNRLATLNALGEVQLLRKDGAAAEAVLAEALALRRKVEPGSWTVFNTQSMLGAAKLGQGKPDEAAPLLKEGYEGMKQRLDQMTPPARVFVTQALDRLIQIAEATNKPDEVKAWTEERAKWLASPASGPAKR